MDDLVFVHVVECSANLTDNISGHVLRNSPSLFEIAIKLTRDAELHGQIDEVFIREETVHLDNVRMVQEHLNFYLSQ